MSALNLDEERVALLVHKWRLLLLPAEWSLGVRVLDECPESDRESYADAFAYTEVEGAYFSAKITFLRRRFADKDGDFLDLVACHEVLHVVLHMSEHLVGRACKKDKHTAEVVTENAVEILSRAFLKLQNRKHKS